MVINFLLFLKVHLHTLELKMAITKQRNFSYFWQHSWGVETRNILTILPRCLQILW